MNISQEQGRKKMIYSDEHMITATQLAYYNFCKEYINDYRKGE